MNKYEALNFVAGLLSGALVGAAAVLLLTPQSGTDIRQTIANKAKEIVEAGKQARIERQQALEAQYKAAIRIPLPLDQEEAA